MLKDALNFTLLLDQKMEKRFETLAPYMGVFSLESPREISGSLEMPKPVVGTIASWIEDVDLIPDQSKINSMLQYSS